MSDYDLIENTAAYPYIAVAKIVVTFADGTQSSGSGAVVGRNDVLTAAHLVDHERGVRATSVLVMPGHDSGWNPVGVFEARAWRYFKVQSDDGRFTSSDIDDDVALLTVDSPRPIGDVTGWFGLKTPGWLPGRSAQLNHAGYPAEFGSDEMLRVFGTETMDWFGIRHDYAIETGWRFSGASGGPFWTYDGESRHIVGVMSTTNHATYISPALFRTLSDWMSENDGAAGVARRGGPGDDVLKGGPGPDVLRGLAGADRLLGLGGADRIIAGPGDDAASGGGGRDALKGGGGADRLRGGSGDDRISGARGDDRLDGGPGRDALAGGRGEDRLEGGGGRDALTGGSGRDLFVFDARSGTDRISDWQDGRDRIAFETGADRFRDLEIVDAGDDVVIRHRGGRIRLEDVDADDIGPADFLF